MTDVDQLYQSAVAAMPPCERVARSVAMFNWSREFLGRQITKSNPGVSHERLKLLMYHSEPAVCQLIEGLLEQLPADCDSPQPSTELSQQHAPASF